MLQVRHKTSLKNPFLGNPANSGWGGELMTFGALQWNCPDRSAYGRNYSQLSKGPKGFIQFFFFGIFRYKFLAKGFQILKRIYDMKYKDQNKKACILGEVGIMQGKEKNKTHQLSFAPSEKWEELFHV